MPNSLRLKRSSVPGKVPLTTDLELGELAVNTHEGKLYLKKDNGTASIVEVTGGGGSSGPVALTINAKSSAYTIVAGDLGKVVTTPLDALTSVYTHSITLTAAATLGAGFYCWVWNIGVGNITIDADGSETIDGVATLILRRGEGVELICTGTNWQTGSTKRPRGYAESIDANAARPIASGQNSVAIGGNSAASGFYSLAVGDSSVASGSASFALGIGAIASGSNATAFGLGVSAVSPEATADGSLSISGGKAQAVGSFAIGRYALSTLIGKGSISGQQRFAADGDSQQGIFVLRRETTNATATVLTTDNSAPGATDQIALPDNSALAFSGTVIARQQAAGGSNFAAWEIKGGALRGSGVGTTTLGQVNVNRLSASAGASAWTVALSADTTNGAVAITVTGAASTNIRWVATVQTSEVTYA